MAEWRINGDLAGGNRFRDLNLALKSFAPDVFTFTQRSPFDTAHAFAHGSDVVLTKDGVTWFRGKIRLPETYASPQTETKPYEAVGPWDDLERTPYQQQWRIWTGTEVVLVYKSRCVLGQAADGSRQTLAQAATEIIAYAISAGVNLQIGTIDISGTFPFEEFVDQSCGEVLRKILRWAPDAASWIDYATTPPTINIRSRSALSVQSGLLFFTRNKLLRIKPRADLAPPVVAILYERINTHDDNSYRELVEDKFPADQSTQQPGALVFSVELAGSRITSQRQRVEVAAWPEDNPEWIEWLKAKNPWLANPVISDITIVGDVDLTSELPRELVEGLIPDWLNKDAAPCTVSATLNYTQTVDGDPRPVVEHLITVNTIATNAITKTYRKNSVDEVAEPIPTGLAQRLYTSLNALHYEGQYVRGGPECLNTYRPGMRLNLFGGEAIWQTMGALIQVVTHQIDTGTTTVDFGPPSHLNLQDYIELMRANRSRLPAHSAPDRDKDEPGESTDLEIQGIAPRQNATSAPIVPPPATFPEGTDNRDMLRWDTAEEAHVIFPYAEPGETETGEMELISQVGGALTWRRTRILSEDDIRDLVQDEINEPEPAVCNQNIHPGGPDGEQGQNNSIFHPGYPIVGGQNQGGPFIGSLGEHTDPDQTDHPGQPECFTSR